MGRRGRQPLVAGQGGEYGVRAVLLMAVFALTGWAFWGHFQTRFEAIAARSLVLDEGEALNGAERDHLAVLVASFRQRWGLRAVVHLRTGPVTVPELGPETLFVGLSPQTHQAVVVLPPLAVRLVPGEMRRRLELELDACGAARPPGACLAATLETLLGAFGASPESP